MAVGGLKKREIDVYDCVACMYISTQYSCLVPEEVRRGRAIATSNLNQGAVLLAPVSLEARRGHQRSLELE